MISGSINDTVEQPVLYTFDNPLPSHLELTVKKTEKCALINESAFVGSGSSKSCNMLTVAVRVQKNISQGLKVSL